MTITDENVRMYRLPTDGEDSEELQIIVILGVVLVLVIVSVLIMVIT